MLNRRHLRIKILHVLYAFYQDEDRDVVKTKKALDHSIEKMQELYLLLLLMIGSMQSFAIDRIEAGRKKQLPSPEDLHPNTKFVTNRPLRVLANSKNLSKAAADGNIGWGITKKCCGRFSEDFSTTRSTRPTWPARNAVSATTGNA